jgi:hypothetical protein
VKRFASISTSSRSSSNPAAGAADVETPATANNEEILMSFSNRVGSQLEIMPSVEGAPLVPSKMGETMTSKQSQAMVQTLKNGGESKESARPNALYLCHGRSASRSVNDATKQQAELMEEMKKLATLRHQVCPPNFASFIPLRHPHDLVSFAVSEKVRNHNYGCCHGQGRLDDCVGIHGSWILV